MFILNTIFLDLSNFINLSLSIKVFLTKVFCQIHHEGVHQLDLLINQLDCIHQSLEFYQEVYIPKHFLIIAYY